MGAIAGLATITPAAGFVKPWAAVVIGAAGAIVCYVCVKLVTKLGLDDALDVWGVHGMGGFLGTVLLGALAEHDVNGVSRSWKQVGKQLAAASLAAAYSFVAAYIMIKGLMLVTDVVPDREAVKTGLDYSMHGMLAHNADDIDAYPNRPDGRKKKPIEPTAEMDGSGAKIQVQLPAE